MIHFKLKSGRVALVALAVVCADTIADESQRAAVLARLHNTGHDVLLISYDQLDAFARNMLELRNTDGERVIAMSTRAWNSLDAGQREILRANGRVVHAAIDNIEDSAGGSVRCMLAEIHLPALR